MTPTRIIGLALPTLGTDLALAPPRAQQADARRAARPPVPAPGGVHAAPPREPAPALGIGLALAPARAQQADARRAARPPVPAAGGVHGAPPRETVTVAGDEPIPNVPGKRLVSHVVDYPPGGGSAPHRHARSAFVYAY